MMKDSVIHVMEKIGIKKLREASVEKYEAVNDLIGFWSKKKTEEFEEIEIIIHGDVEMKILI